MTTAVLDTSVLVAPRAHLVEVVGRFDDCAVSVATVGELEHGLLAAGTDWELRFKRELLYRRVRQTFRVLPIDSATAREYAKLCFMVGRSGRSHRSRVADLLIAATAAARDYPLVTANAADLRGAEGLVEIISIGTE
jgi:predicted nucleic acid-binding protein